jgi:hypothetical protein
MLERPDEIAAAIDVFRADAGQRMAAIGLHSAEDE